jgi:hypothetical protein
MDLMLGDQSFYIKGFDTISSLVRGMQEFSPKLPLAWGPTELYVNLDHSEPDALIQKWEDGDTAETNIDGISEYAIGLWFRYLTTFPTRVFKKPNWQ